MHLDRGSSGSDASVPGDGPPTPWKDGARTEPPAAAAAPSGSRSLRAASTGAPPQATVLALGALFLVATAFLFCCHCVARALIGGFGGGIGTALLAALATAGASIFLFWLAPLADFAEICWIHLPADRRARAGCCPSCGYPHNGRDVCTECGEGTAPLAAWTLSWRPVRRFSAVLLAAIAIGVAGGEAWTRLDESRFASEVARARGLPIARPRAFPAGFARLSANAQGVCTSAPWQEPGRERSWKPADPMRRERGLGWKQRADEAERRSAEDASAEDAGSGDTGSGNAGSGNAGSGNAGSGAASGR